MANRELNVVLGIKLNEFEKGLRNAEKSLDRFAKKAQALGKSLTQNLTLPIVAVGGSAVAAFTNLERMEKGLAAVMGSSEAAQIELRKLNEVAKLPGLGFEQAVQGSIRLQAVGLSADEARETLSAFGAAIAATGGTAQNLESVQYQLTQMISKNRILQEDFGIIQENVPLVGKAIEAAFGTRNVEQIRASGVSAQEFNRRIVEALKNLPETQNAVGGLGNAFENFTDSLKLSLAEFGRAINDSLHLEQVLDLLGRGIQKVVDYFRELSPQTQRIIVITAALVAGIGPAIFIMGKLALVIKSVASALAFLVSPIGITIAAIGAIVAAVVILYNKFEGVRKVVNGVIDIFVEFIKVMTEGAQAFFRGFKNLSEGNFKAAAKDFGEALRKSNPITAAITEGKRLGAAFMGGYEDETNRLSGVFSKLSASVGGGAAAIPSGGGGAGDVPTGGGGDGKRTAIVTNPLLNKATLQVIQQNGRALSDVNLVLEHQGTTLERVNEIHAARLEQQQKELNYQTKSMLLMEGLNGIANVLTDTLGALFEKGTNAMKTLINGLKQLVVQLIKTIAKAAILAALLSLIPAGSAVGGLVQQMGFASGKGSFLKNFTGGILGMANGGLVTGPTLSWVGEGRGTSMSNPEVVAPLDKLKSMLDGVMGGGDFVASTRLAGSDLLLVVERAQRDRGR